MTSSQKDISSPLQYFKGHTDHSWYIVGRDHAQCEYQETEIIGNHLRSHWKGAFRRPSFFQSAQYEVIFGNSCVNSLWKKPHKSQLHDKLSAQTHPNVHKMLCIGDKSEEYSRDI